MLSKIRLALSWKRLNTDFVSLKLFWKETRGTEPSAESLHYGGFMFVWGAYCKISTEL